VLPRVPHHVTQRGNHRQQVFFCNGDPQAYLRLLREHSREQAINVIAYCLMPNHVHLVVIPPTAQALCVALSAVHGQYAQRINRMRSQTGHLWQARYFSSPLDADYLLNAVRYVELNPVRAGIVAVAEDYDWSSAAGHCGLRADPVIETDRQPHGLAGIEHWSRWLADGVAPNVVETLRGHGRQNLPCGSEEFVAHLELKTGQQLRFRSRGRPRREPEQKQGRFPSAGNALVS
jgi:putative transposase